MISVITGDIIKSQSIKDPEVWLSALKEILSHISNDPSKWELYRGDSFQIEIDSIEESFGAALCIKACLKSIRGLDVRMAIGIGNKSFEGQNITESNGQAFVFSGETLETLKKEKVNLKIKTSVESMDKELNLYFKLALIAMDHWTTNSAEIVKLALEQPDALQQELAEQLGISQDAVSKRQKRAYLDELLELNLMFKQKLNALK